MKKIICFALAIMLFVLSGCSSQQPNNQTDDYYKFNRAGIAEIEGTSQMSDPVKKVVITKENAERFLNQVEELCLQPTGTNNNTKGWEYFFAIKYDDGSTTSFTLSEGKIEIDGKVYKTNLYKASDFEAYFE